MQFYTQWKITNMHRKATCIEHLAQTVTQELYRAAFTFIQTHIFKIYYLTSKTEGNISCIKTPLKTSWTLFPILLKKCATEINWKFYLRKTWQNDRILSIRFESKGWKSTLKLAWYIYYIFLMIRPQYAIKLSWEPVFITNMHNRVGIIENAN